MMEWIKDYPVHFMVYVALAGFTIYYLFWGREHRGRSLKEMSENNNASLCAGCGKQYENSFYVISNYKYCSSCYSRILYEAKFEVSMIGTGLVIYFIMKAAKFLPGNGRFDYGDLWQLLLVLILGGLIMRQRTRAYRELKKAQKTSRTYKN